MSDVHMHYLDKATELAGEIYGNLKTVEGLIEISGLDTTTKTVALMSHCEIARAEMIAVLDLLAVIEREFFSTG